MVEIITKPKNTFIENFPKKPIILWSTLIFLGAVLAVYGGLYFYSSSLKKDINNLKERIAQAQIKAQSQESLEVVNFINKSELVKQVLASHVYFSGFFGILESLINQKVALSKINVSAEKKFFDIEGLAQSYTHLAKEIVALRTNKNIEGVEVSQISLNPRGLSFRISAMVNSDIFRIPGFIIATSTLPAPKVSTTSLPISSTPRP